MQSNLAFWRFEFSQLLHSICFNETNFPFGFLSPLQTKLCLKHIHLGQTNWFQRNPVPSCVCQSNLYFVWLSMIKGVVGGMLFHPSLVSRNCPTLNPPNFWGVVSDQLTCKTDCRQNGQRMTLWEKPLQAMWDANEPDRTFSPDRSAEPFQRKRCASVKSPQLSVHFSCHTCFW